MFNVGDIVVANYDTPYTITIRGWVGVVTNVDGGEITVVPIEGMYEDFHVREEYFTIADWFGLNTEQRSQAELAAARAAVTLNVPDVVQEEVAPREHVVRLNETKRATTVVQMVEDMKSSEYGLTAIKIELEVNMNTLDRSDSKRIYKLRQGLFEAFSPLGITYKSGNGRWAVKSPCVFARVYNDGSVDTELTLTLSMQDPTAVLLLPKIVEIFNNYIKKYAEDNDGEFDTHKAGMHIALLNNKSCKYPVAQSTGDGMTRFKNFRKSMIRLLPALYFLGSCDASSRGLEYRVPQIEQCPSHHGYTPRSPKYSAVTLHKGALEFRVFETCYQRPDAILDNIAVIGNAMQFWTLEYTPNGLPRVDEKVKFGIQSGYELKRLYRTSRHLDLLYAGLKILKPSYYSILDLKTQRDFTITRSSLKAIEDEIKKKAVEKYGRYRKEAVLKRETDFYNEVANRIYWAFDHAGNDIPSLREVRRKAMTEAKELIRNSGRGVMNRAAYIQNQIEQNFDAGTWVLEGGE